MAAREVAVKRYVVRLSAEERRGWAYLRRAGHSHSPRAFAAPALPLAFTV